MSKFRITFFKSSMLAFFMQGLSAIHLAALDCQLECLKLLVEKMKVDVNHKSPDGWTCLHLTINNLSPKRSLACVNYLLSCGADPSRYDFHCFLFLFL